MPENCDGRAIKITLKSHPNFKNWWIFHSYGDCEEAKKEREKFISQCQGKSRDTRQFLKWLIAKTPARYVNYRNTLIFEKVE